MPAKQLPFLIGKHQQPTLVGRKASADDAVYVVSGRHFLHWMEPPGKLLPDFHFAEEDSWGSPKVWHDQVFLPSDRRVLALDRHTGKILWAFDEFGGDLAVGGGKVFCRQAASTTGP